MITTNFTLGVRIACDGRKILAYGIVYNLQQSVTEFLYRVQLGGVFSYIVIDSQKFFFFREFDNVEQFASPEFKSVKRCIIVKTTAIVLFVFRRANKYVVIPLFSVFI